jgi:hypothetical protein
VRDGRIAGALVGVGAIVGVGFVLLRSKSASAEILAPPPRSTSGGFSPLVERWRGEVTKRAGDLPVDALLEWMRIESGGDTCSVGNAREAGIWQLNFPDDAKYGATLEGLRAICAKSKLPGFSITWLTPAELDMEVGAGIRKVAAARDTVRHVLGQVGARWPETSFDFGSAVKQIHAAPAVIIELLPKITHRDGHAPASWDDFRRSVMTFPVGQMGSGLAQLSNTPSRWGLKNRLEDTLRNAEMVGRAWGARSAPSRGNYA